MAIRPINTHSDALKFLFLRLLLVLIQGAQMKPLQLFFGIVLSLCLMPSFAGTVSGDLRFESLTLNGKSRTLRVYLPPTYTSNPTKKFPVLYMFDAQNLFDAQTAGFGAEWKVDETLEQFVANGTTDGVIVVGIDNEGTGKGRYEEYTNWDWTHPTIGFINARGDETAAWMVNSVLPFINGKYRTLTDRSNTGLAGSSMGGYMTIYTGLSYPQVFGKLASFSTVALNSPMQGQNLRAYVEAAKSDSAKSPYIAGTTVYMDMGDQEQLSYTTSSLLVENHNQMCASFNTAGYAPTCRILPGGVHNEGAWSARFGDTFKLLFPKDGALAKNYNQVYLRGTNNGWTTSAKMNLIANNTWVYTATFGDTTTERFKFDVNGDWAINFGDTNKDGIADASGSDIAITQGAGSYKIRFNDSTRVYTIMKVTGNRAPTANAGPDQTITSATPTTVNLNGAASSDSDGTISQYNWAEFINNTWQTVGSGSTLTLNNVSLGQHRYRLSVTDNQSASASDEVLVTVSAPGFTKVYNKVYLRGTNNGWATTAPMSLVANNTWEVTASFGTTSTERFKFDINGDWSLNFGDTNKDGIADQTGSDIAISQGSGSYKIRFNDSSRVYSITKQ